MRAQFLELIAHRAYLARDAATPVRTNAMRWLGLTGSRSSSRSGRFRKPPSLGFSGCLVLESARKAGHGPQGTLDRARKIEGAKRLGGR